MLSHFILRTEETGSGRWGTCPGSHSKPVNWDSNPVLLSFGSSKSLPHKNSLYYFQKTITFMPFSCSDQTFKKLSTNPGALIRRKYNRDEALIINVLLIYPGQYARHCAKCYISSHFNLILTMLLAQFYKWGNRGTKKYVNWFTQGHATCPRNTWIGIWSQAA